MSATDHGNHHVSEVEVPPPISIRKLRVMHLLSRPLGGLLCASLVFPAAEGETTRISDLIDRGWLCRIGGWIFLSNAAQSAGTEPRTALPISDDATLVAAVLRRDRKATAEFLSLHADPVYTYVRNRLIPRTDLVEDVFQDVFLAAWQGLAGFRGASSLRSWLLGIARHKVEDYYRLKLREPLPIETEEGEPLPLAVEPEFDEAVDQERLTEKVRQILSTLPEVYSLALLWRYWENRSASEMAAGTGRTEKAVERILARAREQFRLRWRDE